MTEKIIIAGAGGQGVMLLGKVLAEAALQAKKYVTWLPSYGAEVRGGTAHCMVIISDEEIGSPYISKSDTLIIMNEPSLIKFQNRLDSPGFLLANSSLIDVDSLRSITSRRKNSAQIFTFPFTDIAVKLGNIRIANMVCLGFYLAKKKVIDVNYALDAIEAMAPADKKGLIEINKQAIFAGVSLIRDK